MPCLFDMIFDTVTHVLVNSLLWPSLEIVSFQCGWRILKGSCSRPQSLSSNSIILLNWDLSISAGIFCCVRNRVEVADMLLSKYLTFHYLKFSYINTQIFVEWMKFEAWNWLNVLNMVLKGQIFSKAKWRKNLLSFFQWENRVWWTHPW